MPSAPHSPGPTPEAPPFRQLALPLDLPPVFQGEVMADRSHTGKLVLVPSEF